MAPIQEFCQLERVYGPTNISRFNLFTSINVTATVADGYSTGEAIKAAEKVAADILPAGYSYEYQGLTRDFQTYFELTGSETGTTPVENSLGITARALRLAVII